jgi:hypothetical protein
MPIALLLPILLLLAPRQVQEPLPLDVPATPSPAPDEQVQAQIDSLTQELRQYVDWNREYETIRQATENLWQEHGWTSESDLFAKSIVLEVERIPPWETTRRIEFMNQMIVDRYGLSPRDALRAKTRMFVDLIKLIPKHGPAMMRLTNEYFDTRAEGLPITPDMVSRWMADSEGMFADLTGTADSMAELIGGMVGEEYKERFNRDFESYRHRMETFEQLRQNWAEGKWKAEDWGLENDPLQLQNTPADPFGPGFSSAQRAALVKRNIEAAPHFDYDPSTWERYVRACIQLYDFTPAQIETAHSILLELLSRAADFTRAQARQRSAGSVAGRAQDNASSSTGAEQGASGFSPTDDGAAGSKAANPIATGPTLPTTAQSENTEPSDHSGVPQNERLRALFSELRERIERIPTRTQKRAAESQIIEIE